MAKQTKTVNVTAETLMAVARNLLLGLLAAHPLQVRTRYNQLQSLFVTMTDGELLHAWR
jgi:hypothetical protein